VVNKKPLSREKEVVAADLVGYDQAKQEEVTNNLSSQLLCFLLHLIAINTFLLL
jgi:hypothetical protein